ncbi:MAG TPA: hypothetical protein VMZ11_09665 [Mycobacteriales bacterium]|nr:hypothetical protein [Mycobacteriales bacterium]
MMRRPLAALLAAPLLLLGACSDDSSPLDDPDVAASAPVPGVSLPAGDLQELVPAPTEVPAGMVPVVLGSGPRSLDEVAGYSGTGAVKAQAVTSLRAHGFTSAYVAQYANQATGQALSVVVSRFASTTGATADFSDDQKGTSGTPVTTDPIGEASSVTTQDVPGSVTSQLTLVRFLRGTDTWVIAYQAAPKADPAVPVALAKALLARTAT